MRAILKGCVIGFSRIMPLDKPFETDENVILAEMFGAKCHPFQLPMEEPISSSAVPKFTHIVASGITQKVKYLKGILPKLKVVSLAWLRDSIFNFDRKSETTYQFKVKSSKPQVAVVEEEEEEEELNGEEEKILEASASSSSRNSGSNSPVIVSPSVMVDPTLLEDMQRELEAELGSEGWNSSSSDAEESAAERFNQEFNDEDDPNDNEE